MKLPTKATYSIKAMLDIALHFDEGPISVKRISERQNVSERYLEQLFILLRVARLARGIPGAKGGFSLTKPPSGITLSEIIQATEGSIAPVGCVDEPGLCSLSDVCVMRNVWSRMKQAMDDVLESVTLQDLVEQQRQIEQLSKEKVTQPQ